MRWKLSDLYRDNSFDDFMYRRNRAMTALAREQRGKSQRLVERSYERSKGQPWERQAAEDLFQVLIQRRKSPFATVVLERIARTERDETSVLSNYMTRREVALKWESINQFRQAEELLRLNLTAATQDDTHQYALLELAEFLTRRQRLPAARGMLEDILVLQDPTRYSHMRSYAARAFARMGPEYLARAQDLMRANLALAELEGLEPAWTATQELVEFDEKFGTTTSPERLSSGAGGEVGEIRAMDFVVNGPAKLLFVGETIRQITVDTQEALAAGVTPARVENDGRKPRMLVVSSPAGAITATAIIDDESRVRPLRPVDPDESVARSWPLGEVFDYLETAPADSPPFPPELGLEMVTLRLP